MPYSYLIDMLSMVLYNLLKQGTDKVWNMGDITHFVRYSVPDNKLTDLQLVKLLRDTFRAGVMDFNIRANYMGDGLKDAITRVHSVSYVRGNDDSTYTVRIEGRRLKLVDARDYIMFARNAHAAWIDNQAAGNDTYVKD